MTGRAELPIGSNNENNSYGLANDAATMHTPLMSLKSAALLALIGVLLLSVLAVAHFVTTVTGVLRDVIPAMALLTSIIHVFACLSVLVFLYVFYQKQ